MANGAPPPELLSVARRLHIAYFANRSPVAPGMVQCLDHKRPEGAVLVANGYRSLCATVEADLAVVPLLASTVPSLLEVLSFAAGLPPLPMFQINLHLPRKSASDVADRKSVV